MGRRRVTFVVRRALERSSRVADARTRAEVGSTRTVFTDILFQHECKQCLYIYRPKVELPRLAQTSGNILETLG